jgi:hypothetical protein
MKDPAPVCRGCKHIREIDDPKQINRFLGGRPLPAPEDLDEFPETLLSENVGKPFDPDRLARDLEKDDPMPWGRAWPRDKEPVQQTLSPSDPAPTLQWTGRKGYGWILEISSDGFESQIHNFPEEGVLTESQFAVPEEVWATTLPGTYDWRIRLADDWENVVWRGTIVKRAVDPAPEPPSDV